MKMSAVDTSPDTDVLNWSPVVPRPPKPEVRLAAAVLFIPGYVYKELGYTALVAAALAFCGPIGIALSTLPAAYGAYIIVDHLPRGVRRIRRFSYGTARPQHETPGEFAMRWNSSGRERLLYAMRHGGTHRLDAFDHGLKELPETRAPSGVHRFVYRGRYLRAQEEFRCSYNRVVWEAGELRTFRDWASSRRRPCAPRLEQWLDQHAAGHPELALFVYSLLLIARESDPRLVADVARRKEDHFRWKREQRLALAEKERKEIERRAEAQRELRARQHEVRYVPVQQDWESERAAEWRWRLAMATLAGRVAALGDAVADLRSRGEYLQLEHVQRERSRLLAELERWEEAAHQL
ncbi:MAG: hypothetical protein IT435_04315 [Phycisphaerales bacterium]|nr:hypothetical protein [Phycisphaerales bacterium]